MSCNNRQLSPDIKLKISQGDEQAFEIIYRIYYKKLLKFAKTLLKSAEMAEEVVEDVFVKVWCNREMINEINDLTLYLYSAVKKQCLNVLAKNSNAITTSSIELIDLDFYDTDSDPHDQLVTTEMMNNVRHIIDCLPTRCRLIFKMIREDGLKYKEVAEILNISVNTIDVQMAIAVKRICTSLKVKQKKVGR